MLGTILLVCILYVIVCIRLGDSPAFHAFVHITPTHDIPHYVPQHATPVHEVYLNLLEIFRALYDQPPVWSACRAIFSRACSTRGQRVDLAAARSSVLHTAAVPG